jgi:hypothetical protein
LKKLSIISDIEVDMDFEMTPEGVVAAIDVVNLPDEEVLTGLRDAFERALGVAPAYSMDPLDWIKQYWSKHVQPLIDDAGDRLEEAIAKAEGEARNQWSTLSTAAKEVSVRTWRDAHNYIDAMHDEKHAGPRTQDLFILLGTAEVLKGLLGGRELDSFAFNDWYYVALFYMRMRDRFKK